MTHTISLPPPPPPGANHVSARRHGDLLVIAGQHLVADGAGDVLIDALGERGRHARTAVATPVLPLDTPVEVQLVLGIGAP